VNALTGAPTTIAYTQGNAWTTPNGADAMTLNEGLARDPPKTRRFRLLVPVLILLALALLAMLPGILTYIGDRPGDEPVQKSLERFPTYEGR
jgi:hypothetical protein